MIRVLTSAIKNALTPGNTAASETPYKFFDSLGKEILFTGEQTRLVRIFFVKGRAFVLTLTARHGANLNFSKPVLDSFRLLSKTERIRARIDESMPAALPQERPLKSPPPDTLELGLRGPVKRIRETYQPTGASEKLFSRELHFDNVGFILRDIGFNEGFPDVITSWGWLAGKRVNTQSAVEYSDDDRPLSSRRAVVSGGDLGGRYGNHLDSAYDEKSRLIKRRVLTNDESVIYVEHFTYQDNIRTTRTIDSLGSFMGQLRDRLDSSNNVLETHTLDIMGRRVESKWFEYRFDENGNWVEKRVFRLPPERRSKASKPEGTYIRDILYFTPNEERLVGYADPRLTNMFPLTQNRHGLSASSPA